MDVQKSTGKVIKAVSIFLIFFSFNLQLKLLNREVNRTGTGRYLCYCLSNGQLAKFNYYS